MRTIQTALLATLLITLFTACQKEQFVDDTEGVDNPTTDNPIDASAELLPYFQAFIDAGNARGLNIPADLNGITYAIEPINNGNVAGYCYWNSATPNSIVINSEFWSWADNDLKEQIVFHELGHCFLDRDHDDGALNNGICKSIMHSGTQQNCNHAYTGVNKPYYQDELFGGVVVSN